MQAKVLGINLVIKDRGHHYTTWSQYANAFDGFIYWSQVTGSNKSSIRWRLS